MFGSTTFGSRYDKYDGIRARRSIRRKLRRLLDLVTPFPSKERGEDVLNESETKIFVEKPKVEKCKGSSLHKLIVQDLLLFVRRTTSTTMGKKSQKKVEEITLSKYVHKIRTR